MGTVIALNLLFGIPMIYAAIFGALDVILILAITYNRYRILEQMFIIFVSIISFGYLHELFIVQSDPLAIEPFIRSDFFKPNGLKNPFCIMK